RINSEEHELKAEQYECSPDEHEVEVDVLSGNADGTREQRELERETGEDEKQSRNEKEACRTKQQQLPRHTPTISNTASLWAVAARLKANRHFHGAQPRTRGLEQHLARKLHPCRTEGHPVARLPR